MTPIEAIEGEPPNVWLTNFYGFSPEKWGFLGFSSTGQRDRFIRETAPDALVVIYGHKSRAVAEQQGQVIGIQQVSHRVNFAKAFMDPTEWAAKESDPEAKGKWNLAVKATRAWRVAPESYVPIDEFAPDSYSTERAQHIGSQGVRLTPEEARGILDLILVETTVFGEIQIDAASPVKGELLFSPSKPGPVSQSPYFTKEAEGPKENYILRLSGDADNFLGREARNQWIVKVGMSVSPRTRQDALNAALPAGVYKWTVIRSNSLDGRPPYPNSRLALVGEAELKRYLDSLGQSLEGEFFLASPAAVDAAWEASQKSVEEYPSV